MILPYKKVKICLPYNNLQVFNVCVQFSYMKEQTTPPLKPSSLPLTNINHSIEINTFKQALKEGLCVVLMGLLKFNNNSTNGQPFILMCHFCCSIFQIHFFPFIASVKYILKVNKCYNIYLIKVKPS